MPAFGMCCCLIVGRCWISIFGLLLGSISIGGYGVWAVELWCFCGLGGDCVV